MIASNQAFTEAGSEKLCILDAAARLFRERGPDVSVADVTRAAGLTHGGFYNHFASKDALFAEAVETTLVQTAGRISEASEAGGQHDYIEAYASRDHLADVGAGCMVAALGTDLARESTEVRAAYARGLRCFLNATASALEMDRSEALAQISSLIGALIMARGVAGVDDDLADELLEAVRKMR